MDDAPVSNKDESNTPSPTDKLNSISAEFEHITKSRLEELRRHYEQKFSSEEAGPATGGDNEH